MEVIQVVLNLLIGLTIWLFIWVSYPLTESWGRWDRTARWMYVAVLFFIGFRPVSVAFFLLTSERGSFQMTDLAFYQNLALLTCAVLFLIPFLKWRLTHLWQ